MEAYLNGLKDVLHIVSQALLYPVLTLLLIAVGYALFCLGSVLVEYFRERKYFSVVIPKFLRAIEETPIDDVPAMIASSGLLREQQQVLLCVFENRDLDEEARWALAKKLLLMEKERRGRVVSRNDSVAKVAPMIGLMGTLIPLGPGIVAFGQGDAQAMASSMLIAFDTTVSGLLVAATVFVIARIRRRWYATYQSSIEAGVTTLLERIDNMTPEERRATDADGLSKGWMETNAAAKKAAIGDPQDETEPKAELEAEPEGGEAR